MWLRGISPESAILRVPRCGMFDANADPRHVFSHTDREDEMLRGMIAQVADEFNKYVSGCVPAATVRLGVFVWFGLKVHR